VKILPKVLKCLFLCAVSFAALSVYNDLKPQPIEPMTLQRRASHRIEYMSDGRPSGWCTGTAIGPHAILTASHCNNEEKTDTIRFDEATRDFHIEDTITDDRDHDIYFVDGPEFTNVVPYAVRTPRLGEHVKLYGSGGAAYPPRKLSGVRISYDDPSDIDSDAGIVRFSMPVIPGDSGSAVFNDDGTIAAVTTYLHREEFLFGHLQSITTIDFTPAFTPDQIAKAVAFKPTEYHAPVKEKKNLNDPFGLFPPRIF
jgi:hypothetical protein